MTKIEKIRDIIVSSSVPDAQSLLLRVLRRTARHIVYEYAKKHSIFDFDSVLTEQIHRDKLQSDINTAQSKVTDIQAATTVDELLIIFDQIADKQ